MNAAPKPVELVFEVPWTHPAWVLEDEPVSESAVQDGASDAMASTLRAWARRQGRAVMVRRNLAVRWDEANPRVGVDPDVCLLDPPPATPEVELTGLRLWEPGNHPPRVAFEVVSASTALKDYDEGPKKHAASGARELWVFDPLRVGPDDGGGPWRIQVWSRGPRGEFRRAYAGDGPARSAELDAWLRASDDGMHLRVCDDPAGARTWLTEAEEAMAAAAQRDAVAAQRDAVAAQRDAVAAQRDAALARVAELEALLAKARDGR